MVDHRCSQHLQLKCLFLLVCTSGRPALQNLCEKLPKVHLSANLTYFNWRRGQKSHARGHWAKLATGDGALGFWAAAVEEEFPGTQQQRCWVHKTANILDKMPQRVLGALQN